SRRRHTRFSRDWSSDVCSSDLLPNRRYPGGEFSRRFWPGQNPIGKTLRQGTYDLEVVGVARDAQISHLARSDEPYVYLPAGPKEQSDLQFLAHSASGYATTAASIQATVRALDAELTVNIARLEDNFEYFRFPGRVLATLS